MVSTLNSCLAVLIATCVLVGDTGNALACDCGLLSPSTFVNSGDYGAVYIARIVSVSPNCSSGPCRRSVTLEITESMRGPLRGRQVLPLNEEGTRCDMSIATGERWLIFESVSQGHDARFLALSQCRASQRLPASGDNDYSRAVREALRPAPHS